MTSLFPPKKWGKRIVPKRLGQKIRMAEIVVHVYLQKKEFIFIAFFYLYGEGRDMSITAQQPTLSRICKKTFLLLDRRSIFPGKSSVFRGDITHTHPPPTHMLFFGEKKKHHAMLDRRKKHDTPPTCTFANALEYNIKNLYFPLFFLQVRTSDLCTAHFPEKSSERVKK